MPSDITFHVFTFHDMQPPEILKSHIYNLTSLACYPIGALPNHVKKSKVDHK